MKLSILESSGSHIHAFYKKFKHILMSILYVPSHLLDAKDPVVNKIDILSLQGANDLVRMKDTEW